MNDTTSQSPETQPVPPVKHLILEGIMRNGYQHTEVKAGPFDVAVYQIDDTMYLSIEVDGAYRLCKLAAPNGMILAVDLD